MEKANMNTEEFQKKTMLVKLEKHQLSTTITDKATSAEVRTRKGVSTKGGTWKKKLFTKGYEEIRAIFNRVTKTHNRYTVPYGDDGFAMLKADLYEIYKSEMDQLCDELDAAVDRFIDGLETCVESDREALGETFSIADYPSEEEIRDRISVEYKFQSLPNLNGVQINAFSMKELVEQNEKRLKEIMQDAARKPMEDLLKLLEKAAETLGDPDKIFRNSLIGNMKEYVGSVKDLNLTDSPEVTKLAADVEGMLGQIDNLEELRSNKEFRSEAGAKVMEVADRIKKIAAPKLKK